VNLALNLNLWIAAGLLAAVFLVSSSAKLFVPKDKLATVPLGGWTGDASVGFVKALGALELLAAVGLVLPAALDIAPVLVPLAAVGAGLLMVGAMITHLRRHEAVGVVLNLVYLALAGFVAWGRFGPESFTG
jgi:DoxX-like family